MKTCPNCKKLVEDDHRICQFCGTPVEDVEPTYQQAPPPYQEPQYQQAPPQYQAPQYQQVPPQYQQVPPQYVAPIKYPHDHTDEFEKEDISDNKVIAVLVYLLGIFGVIIAMLGAQNSKYVSFHVRQSLKITVVEILTGIAMFVISILCLIPILGLIFVLVEFVLLMSFAFYWVIKIIAICQIFSGKACEPLFIRNLKFLK